MAAEHWSKVWHKNAVKRFFNCTFYARENKANLLVSSYEPENLVFIP